MREYLKTYASETKILGASATVHIGYNTINWVDKDMSR